MTRSIAVIPVLCAFLLSTVLRAETPIEDSIRSSASTFVFAPLRAPAIEARNGFAFFSGEKKLRLDIGGSVDLITWRFDTCSPQEFALGADFFTWTSLREERSFHFPVDAVDYLFGINASWAQEYGRDLQLSGRLRLSHISAHMVDGRYDKESSTWKDGQLPRVYSREYAELVLAIERPSHGRIYSGVQYIYHIDPGWLGKMGYRFGLEYWRNAVIFPWVHLHAAYDLQLVDIHSFVARHTALVGIKWGDWRGKGINTFLTWFSGYSIHGEYFDLRESFWGPGISVDF